MIWPVPDLKAETLRTGVGGYTISATAAGVQDGVVKKAFRRDVFEWEGFAGGASCMNAFYEYFTDKRHWATAMTPCDYGKWPLGEWRMCVMTWTAEKVGFSKNGEPIVEEAYGDRFGELSGFAVSAPAINAPGRFYQIDEFAVLGRKLTDAEIRTVYDAFGPRQVRHEAMENDKEAR